MRIRSEIEKLKADNGRLREKYIQTLDANLELAAFIETLQKNVIYLLEENEKHRH